MQRPQEPDGEAQIAVRLPAKLRRQLEEVAARNERNLSQELRRAVRLYVESQQEAA